MLRRSVLVACCCFGALVLCRCDRIKEVLNGLEKVLKYVEENERLMNIDAVFGLVLGQAHLSYIIAHDEIPHQYLEQLLAIETTMAKVLEETRRLLELTPRNDLFINTVMTVEAWIKNTTFVEDQINAYDIPVLRKVNSYEKYVKFLTDSRFEEKNSDDCMIELLQQQKYCCIRHACVISRECYRTMRLDARKDSIDPGYGVTHSLLFLQVARSQMCIVRQTLLNEKIRRFCSYILWELRQNVQYGFLGVLDDLLLEQVTLCGYEGFAEFFAKDIIEHVLWMQKPSGCFTVRPQQIDIESPYLEKQKTLDREKRESNMLSGNCIDHTTGLGVSTLALILRYLFQRPLSDESDYVDY